MHKTEQDKWPVLLDGYTSTKMAESRLRLQETGLSERVRDYTPLTPEEWTEVIGKYSEFIRLTDANARSAKRGVINKDVRESALLYNYQVLCARVTTVIGETRRDALFGSGDKIKRFHSGLHGTVCTVSLGQFI